MHPSLSPLLHSYPGRVSLFSCWDILWVGKILPWSSHRTGCTELKELQSTKKPAGTSPSCTSQLGNTRNICPPLLTFSTGATTSLPPWSCCPWVMPHASPLPVPWFDATGRTSLNPNPFSICPALSHSTAHPSPLRARMSQLGAPQPGHNPRFLHAVMCCHTGKNDCGAAGTMGSHLENSSTHFSPQQFSPEPRRDPGMNNAAVGILGRAELLPGVLNQHPQQPQISVTKRNLGTLGPAASAWAELPAGQGLPGWAGLSAQRPGAKPAPSPRLASPSEPGRSSSSPPP